MCVHIWTYVNHIWTCIYVCSYMNICGRKIPIYDSSYMCVHIWTYVNHISTCIYVCSYMNICGRKISVYKFRIWTPHVFSTRLPNGRIRSTVTPCLQHHESGYKTRSQLPNIHRCTHIWWFIYEQSYMDVHICASIYEPYYLGQLIYF